MAGAGAYLAILLNNQDEERLKRNRSRLRNRQLRDASTPFDLPERQFVKMFRINQEAAQYIINTLSPHMINEIRNTSIPKHLRILCALHFFGHGSYQLDSGANNIFNMSQPAVSRSISSVIELINNVLLNQWIVFPREPEAINRNVNMFQNRYNFPGIVGVIDCTHIAIISPPVLHPVYPAGPYYNRKGYYSINVQIICNAKLEIINMNARFPGSIHDAGIWRMSNINRHLQHEYLNDNLNYHLIGDEGYPLSPWLMVKHPGDIPVELPEGRFNQHIISARTTIERVNGILKGRFRCPLKHRTLNYNPIKAARIIHVCGVLHNIAIHFNAPLPEDIEYEENENIVNEDYNVADFNDYFGRPHGKAIKINKWVFWSIVL